MIKNAKATYDPKAVKESTKPYFLLLIGDVPAGICTHYETAQACIRYYAEEKNAVQLKGDTYLYEDKRGKHLMYIKEVKRLSIPYAKYED